MVNKLNSQRFGAHLSVAGGLENAFIAARTVGCDCLQIFVKNQRQWSAPPLTEAQVRAYRDAERSTGIGPVVAHATYLLNLASPNDDIRQKSIRALIDELNRCEALGVAALVLHPGAHMGAGVDAGIARIARSIDEVHTATRGYAVRILLETTAGQGTTLGHDITQLGSILAATAEPGRLGVCLDTCHLFAAGYDLRVAEPYERMMHALTTSVGLARVACIHVNDSKGDLGSRLDRHEHIAQGRIGRAGFHRLLNDPRLEAVPRILETPKGVDARGRELDRVNLARLRRMIDNRPSDSAPVSIRAGRSTRPRAGVAPSRRAGRSS